MCGDRAAGSRPLFGHGGGGPPGNHGALGTSDDVEAYALRLLAARPHGTAELGRKLARRNWSREQIEGALAMLGRKGYLDDRAFAASVARLRSQRNRWSSALILRELLQRGVSELEARQGIADCELADDRELARAAAAGLLRPEQQSLGQFLEQAGPKLARRGFSPAQIRQACGAIWEQRREVASGPDGNPDCD